MRSKWITGAIVVVMAALGFVAWRNSMEPAAPAPESAATQPSLSSPEGVAPHSPPPDPGIAWSAPAGWTEEAERPMRLATYAIPARGADVVQCAVYYFGPGQGGTADANIERWIGEFESPKNPERSTLTIDGLTVTRARIRGTYQSHGGAGAMTPEQLVPRGDQQLVGAIVEGPAGPVFFKLTGPAGAVDGAVSDFDGMIASVRRK